ncbi:MAG: deoxyribodipyrimidine photo-lyase, partial [Candidatus Thermoplasmatota archaeon]|nr:deoxyribodipyrimidine photo-lyase [Candidatus Thermoplasmatota archaeon]
MATTLVWFERDLRLADHPALYAACQDGAAVPVYIWAPDEHGEWAPGAASRWWLHHALDELGQALEEAGSRLILREGPSLDALLDLAETAEADQVVWHERHEPALAARDATIREALEEAGLGVLTLRARMLHDPEAVQTTSKGPYHVFTPFWRKLQAELTVGDPVGVPDLADAAPDGWPGRVPLDELGLDPGHAWTQGLADAWEVREAAGLQVLSTFLDERVEAYPEDRDVPATQGTSRLSPYLAHGHVSPRQAWHAAQSRMEDPQTRESAQAFLRQLAWREFAYHLLHHYPETTHEPLKEKFQAFPWREDPEHLE